MNIGFIGLGNMGSGIAANILSSGQNLIVHDLNQAAAAELLENGATWAEDPATVAALSDVVFTSLPGPTEVAAVSLGEKGIIEGIGPGSTYIDLSTSSPSLIRQIFAEFSKIGSHVLDAPVSGGPSGALSGQLAIMVGGDKAIYDKYKPILETFGDRPTYAGSIGSGSICKLMHNCIGYGLNSILAECLTVGVKAGVEPATLLEAIMNGSVGRGLTLKVSLPETYLQGKFDPPRFTLKGARKDVSLALELGRDYDVPMNLANLVYQDMISAINRGWSEKDSRITMLLQEERAGDVKVRVAKK